MRSGLAPTYAAASAGGDKLSPDRDTLLHVKNAGGAASTVTIVTPGSVSGLAIADVSVSVPATTGDRMIGPLPAELFADPADGLAAITYSTVTGVTVAAIRAGD